MSLNDHNPITEAVATERERCAKIAEAHKGAYAREKTYKDNIRRASQQSLIEIRAEERGEDLAADMIAKAIRKTEDAILA